MLGWLTFVATALAIGGADALLAERLRFRTWPGWATLLRVLVWSAVLGIVLHTVPRPPGSSYLVAALVYGLSVSVGGGLAVQAFGASVVESATEASGPPPPTSMPIAPR